MADSDSIKLCECGCGRPAPISKFTDRKRGYVLGLPRRFVHGHHSRGKTHYRQPDAEPTKLCECGCGQEAGFYQKSQKYKGIFAGQPRRFALNHSAFAAHASSRKHGLAGTPIYGIWASMMRRCTDPTHHAWDNYGGRGIRVCEQWHDVTVFVADVGPRPSADHSLDRYPDQNGNYQPGNVRWATAIEQHGNKRNNRLLTLNGKTQCMAAWDRELGLGTNGVSSRLKKGWTIERALTTPRVTS